MRVLVIDDDYVSRTKLKKMLSAYGDCDCAPDGKIGLELFERAHADELPYTLVTVDIDMPGMPGQEVVKNIREFEKEKGVTEQDHTKVLMVTVKKDAHNVAQSYYEGCEGYVAKPVSQAALEEGLNSVGINKE